MAVRKLLKSKLFDQVVLSTDSELIATPAVRKVVIDFSTPSHLCEDQVASVPSFVISWKISCWSSFKLQLQFSRMWWFGFERATDLALGGWILFVFMQFKSNQRMFWNYGETFETTAQTFEDDNKKTDITPWTWLRHRDYCACCCGGTKKLKFLCHYSL